MKYSKLLLVTLPWGEHRFLSGFLNLKCEENLVENLSIHVFPPHVAPMTMWGMFEK
jgi:hypothetical protein